MKYVIYADGACSNNQDEARRIGAYAYILFKQVNGQTMKSNDFIFAVPGATNNQMELKAVIEALKKIEVDTNKLSDVEVIVRSDSQYVVSAINEGGLEYWKEHNWRTKSRTPVKNQDMWTQLDTIMKNFKGISFQKVIGHTDDKWNNYCDKLARKACGSK